MPSRHPTGEVRLHLEALEDRTLLSGNVLASVNQGTLLIVGDTADNGIAISTVSTGNSIQVSGLNSTTVNNGSSATFAANSITSVKVLMQNGNDTVNVNALNLTSALTINAGIGNDSISVQNSSLGSLGIKLGGHGNSGSAQPDNVSIYTVQIAGSASIETGSGGDNVYLWAFTVGGSLNVKMGRGDDSVLAHSVTSSGGKVDGGPGHDRFIVDGLYSGFHIVNFEEILYAPGSTHL
jgi:hypothetical protein